MRLLPPVRVLSGCHECHVALPIPGSQRSYPSGSQRPARNQSAADTGRCCFIWGSILGSLWASLWVQKAKTEHAHGNAVRHAACCGIILAVPARGSPEVALSRRILCATLSSSYASIPPPHFYQIALHFCQPLFNFLLPSHTSIPNHTSTIQLALQLNLSSLLISHFNWTPLQSSLLISHFNLIPLQASYASKQPHLNHPKRQFSDPSIVWHFDLATFNNLTLFCSSSTFQSSHTSFQPHFKQLPKELHAQRQQAAAYFVLQNKQKDCPVPVLLPTPTQNNYCSIHLNTMS